MISLTTQAFARAGLVGNPSDGYFGKTISFVIRDFAATVHLRESEHFEIIPAASDLARFESVEAFLRDQRLNGYYGGARLIKASIKRFHDFCNQHRRALPKRSFTVSYESTIPRLVGLSGSSAIVIATLRALMRFYEVQIPLEQLPSLALSVEKDELRITAGLQDRVIQSFEGVVFMDFDRALLESRGFGEYQPLNLKALPPIYVAYDPARAEISDVTHRNLRALYDGGERSVVEAMQKFRDLTDRGKAALLSGDWKTLGEIVDANFDLRKTIMPIAPENQRMIDVARAAGASAKFAGSGGAICGLFRDEKQFEELSAALKQIGCAVFKPKIFES